MFRKRQSIVALDIGASSIKLIELAPDGSRPVILRAGARPVGWTDNVDRENTESVKELYSAAINQLLKETGLNAQRIKTLVTCVPGDKISIKQIKSVPLSDEELASSLSFEARKHVPVDGEVLMDYQILRHGDNELDILLCVTAKEAVEDHLDLLSRCAIKGQVIDAPPLSIVNAYLLHPESDLTPETSLFIHVGASLTHLCIHRKNGLFFVREIPFAGNHFTQEIAEKCNVGFMEAENLKKQNGIFHNQGNGSEDQAPQKIGFATSDDETHTNVEGLTREIHRSIRFYIKDTGNRRIDQCILSGGSAADPELKKHLESALKRECRLFDPFSGLKSKSTLPGENRHQYTQALGMALRGLHDLLQNQSK